MPAGPAVFRPPVGMITHGRAASAPARGRRSPHGASPHGAGTPGRRPTTAAAAVVTTSTTTTFRRGIRASPASFRGKVGSAGAPATTGRGLGARGGDGGGSASDSVELSLTKQQQQHQQQQPQTGRSPRPAPRSLERKTSGSELSTGGMAARTTSPASGVAAAAAAAGAVSRQETLPPWELGLRVGLDGSGGWWPAAKSAVEDGSRLNIYTGSVLDGRWLNSLDSRLRATMRAMRR